MESLSAETIIYAATAVFVAVALIAVVATMVSRVRRATLGTADVRQKRKLALASGPMRIQGPFELRGRAQPGELTLFLDLDVTVPMAQGMAHFENLGVRLAFEIVVDGVSVATREAQMPAGCPQLHHNMRSETHSEKRIRHVCRVHTFDVDRAGDLVVRGTSEPVGPTTANVLTLWVG